MKISKKGFTLVELIIVTAVLAVLIFSLSPFTLDMLTNAKYSADIANLSALNSVVRMQKILDQLNQPPVYSMVQKALDNGGINEIPVVLHNSDKAFVWNNANKRFEIGYPPGDPLSSLVSGEKNIISPPPEYNIWLSTKQYHGHEYVMHKNCLYYAKWPNINNEPGKTTMWHELTDEWRWYNSYVLGEVVTHNDFNYRAKKITQNYEPPIGGGGPWELIV